MSIIESHYPYDLVRDLCVYVYYCKFENFREDYIFAHFAYAEFRENKILANCRNHFTDICKSCPSREFLASQTCLLKLFAEIKILTKIS